MPVLSTRKNPIFLCEDSNAASIPCPECGSELKYYDSIRRIWKQHGGKKQWLLIERVRCRNKNCRRVHNALPDFIVPHRHYSSEVIEDVIDEVVLPDDELNGSDYPCEMTMARWKYWFERNRENIDGQLKSVGYRVLGFSKQLLISGVSLSDELRKDGAGWLSAIIRLIYNSGGSLRT